ncbi:LOW QUALITY PROTEIN: sperm acrosome-associated protein 9, partial [Salvelinus alpinus]
HNLFKLQQFIFIAALRSQEHAHDRTEPVASVMQVRPSLNSYSHRSFFMLQNISCILNWSCEVGLFCLFSNPGPFFVCSYPHDEVTSCDEARNYYGGVVSLIPLALELLQRLASSYTYCDQHNICWES